jgi:hypothetical protein
MLTALENPRGENLYSLKISTYISIQNLPTHYQPNNLST